MATPRKRWFKTADALGSKAISNDVLAFYVRLAAHLNTRWARDGLTRAQACECVLSPGQLSHIAGSRTRVRCESTASAFAVAFEATVTKLNGTYTVQWPKFADFQGLPPDDGATLGRLSGIESPPPRPRPRPSTLREEEESDPAAVAAAKPKRTRAAPMSVPSDLTPEQKIELLAWVREKHPAHEPRIREHVDACLDHHRKTSNRSRITHWVAACRTWIRNADRFEPRSSARARQYERAQLMADNAREALRLAQEREQRERARIEGAGPDPDVRRLSAGRDAIAH